MLPFNRHVFRLAALAFLSLFGRVAQAEIEFQGLMITSKTALFSLHDTTANTSRWMSAGQTFGGYVVSTYEPKTETLTLTKDGAAIQVRLKVSKVKDARFDVAGQMEIGQGEKVEVLQATFAFDQETAIPLKGGAVFRITPKRRPDGNILYLASFEVSDTDGKLAKLVEVPSIVALPGAEFSVRIGDRGFSFTPK